MNITQSDLLDKISEYCWQHKSIHKDGHEIEYQAVALDDIKQTFAEFMDDGDFFQIVPKSDQSNVEEIDIFNRRFTSNDVYSDDIKSYRYNDYLLYFNFKMNAMTIYKIDIETNVKYPILKKSKIKNKVSFNIIMESLGFN